MNAANGGEVGFEVCWEWTVHNTFDEFAHSRSEEYGAQVVDGNRFVGLRNG